jgi:hypothetical protein
MKFKLFSFVSTVALLCVLVTASNAQSNSNQYFLPQQFPRSPTATALEKYGTYQVNEFTGVPDISIPLYTIEAGGIKIPVTLSYHASGVKVTEAASWVGLGWSVSSGGQISRRTFGLPDDQLYGYLSGHMRLQGTYNSTTIDGVRYQDSVASALCDARPDIYSYDFPGHNGKFFFDGSDGTHYIPRFMPFAPIRISYSKGTYPATNLPVPNNGAMSTINVTDEHGNRYTFGDVGATEGTVSQSGGASNGIWMASAWKIKNMISQNGRDTVSFTYQSDKLTVPTSDTEVYTVTDNIIVYQQANYTASYTGAPAYIGNSITNLEQLSQQINFKNGKVVFDTVGRQDLGGGRLKDIKVYKYNYGTKSMELQKTIVFFASYFGGVKRLRLDSIEIQNKAGSIMQHYRFDYNTSITMPDYTTYAQDYWGYYNGKTTNTMLTPAQSILFNANSGGTPNYVPIGQANRNSDSTSMQAYVLTGIHYPSGGYSTFAYQANQYIDTTHLVALAGGLRIKTISSYDGINPTPVVKTYIYNSARANFFLNYAYFVDAQTHRYYIVTGGTANPSLSCSKIVRSYSSNPHCDLEAYDAATVVYPSVTEYIGAPGNNIGRTDYTFTDEKDSYLDASAAGSLIYLSSFYKRGHLLTQKEYIHKPDGSYQPVKLTTNAYAAFLPVTYLEVGLVIKKVNFNEGVAGNPILPGGADYDDHNSFVPFYYDVISDDSYLTRTTTNIYDTNDTTKTTASTVTYKYDNSTHQQVTRSYHTDSKGNTLITRSKYPADYPAGNAVIDSMVNRNMQAEAIEKYDTLKNVATSVNAITGAQLNQFKTGADLAIVPSKISTLSVSQPLTDFVPSTVSSGSLTGDSRYVQMISFDQYDGQNNIIQYTPRNATPTAILWDYQSEQPVAQVKNATTIYGSYTQAAYTGFEADGKGNWSFSGIPVFNMTAPAGTMVYPLSSGSISLPALLDNTKSYVLSYWSNNGAATVYAGSYLTGAAMTTVNGWTYYEYTIPSGISGGITISGTTTIDELRLYPVAAQMTTYAYDPSGVRTISDTKGMNNYFDYDFFQRMKDSKDFYGSIINNYGYHLYDQTVGNQAQSGTITRNNCPPNTAPGSLTYFVPANKYYSSTLASANAEAVYEVNTNGQAKANTYCGCPVTYINFTLTNNTGHSGYQATFSGIATPYNFPTTGSTVVQVPAGTYATVSVNPVGTFTATFTLGTRTPVTGHSASFSTVVISATSSDSSLTIQ